MNDDDVGDGYGRGLSKGCGWLIALAVAAFLWGWIIYLIGYLIAVLV